MAIYKIFPEQSATLYSFYPTLNTGNDEILEISTFLSVNDSDEVSRALLQFPQDEIDSIFTDKVKTSQFDAYVKLSLAKASELPLNYTLHTHPIAASWEVGTGRLANLPITTDGVSWGWTNEVSGSAWTNGIFPTGITGSYSSNIGGGTWYTSSAFESTQSFGKRSNKDIELKVTNVVNAWVSGAIDNNGIIIKHSPSIEFTTASKFELKYFSSNTHTIYPPCLEIRWNDYYHSSSLQTVNNDKIVATLSQNKGEFQQDSVQRFRVNVRDQYPARLFVTSSLYSTNKLLPTASYWCIKDLDTEEVVIDFDETYTKISADNTSNYFDVYMNGLEPERYYQVLIKTTIDGSVLVLDNNYYFKVIR